MTIEFPEKSDYVTYIFSVGPFRRRRARHMLRNLEFHNPDRFRWMESKRLADSDFATDGARPVIELLAKLLSEIRR